MASARPWRRASSSRDAGGARPIHAGGFRDGRPTQGVGNRGRERACRRFAERDQRRRSPPSSEVFSETADRSRPSPLRSPRSLLLRFAEALLKAVDQLSDRFLLALGKAAEHLGAIFVAVFSRVFLVERVTRGRVELGAESLNQVVDRVLDRFFRADL